MSRFNCKVVEQVPLSIEIIETEKRHIYFLNYKFKGGTYSREIDAEMVMAYLKKYNYSAPDENTFLIKEKRHG